MLENKARRNFFERLGPEEGRLVQQTGTWPAAREGSS